MKKLLLFFILNSLMLSATQAKPVIWKIQSNKAENSLSYKIELNFANRVAKLSNNELILKILPPGGYVPIRPSFAATSSGKIDGMFMGPQYWSQKDPIFAIIGNLVAAWDSNEEYNDWLVNDNGIQYLREAYAKNNIQLIDFTLRPMESLVSHDPIRNIKDFIGKRIRTPQGMVTDYFNSLGAYSRKISFDAAKEAMKNKQVTILDFADIVTNDRAGLYDFSGHTNYPGFHSVYFMDFAVNKDSWDKLSENHQNIIRLVSTEWKANIKKAHIGQIELTIDKLEKNGVKIYNWSDETRREARIHAIPIWKAYANKSDEATKVIEELMQKLKAIGNI